SDITLPRGVDAAALMQGKKISVINMAIQFVRYAVDLGNHFNNDLWLDFELSLMDSISNLEWEVSPYKLSIALEQFWHSRLFSTNLYKDRYSDKVSKMVYNFLVPNIQKPNFFSDPALIDNIFNLFLNSKTQKYFFPGILEEAGSKRLLKLLQIASSILLKTNNYKENFERIINNFFEGYNFTPIENDSIKIKSDLLDEKTKTILSNGPEYIEYCHLRQILLLNFINSHCFFPLEKFYEVSFGTVYEILHSFDSSILWYSGLWVSVPLSIDTAIISNQSKITPNSEIFIRNLIYLISKKLQLMPLDSLKSWLSLLITFLEKSTLYNGKNEIYTKIIHSWANLGLLINSEEIKVMIFTLLQTAPKKQLFCSCVLYFIRTQLCDNSSILRQLASKFLTENYNTLISQNGNPNDFCTFNNYSLELKSPSENFNCSQIASLDPFQTKNIDDKTNIYFIYYQNLKQTSNQKLRNVQLNHLSEIDFCIRNNISTFSENHSNNFSSVFIYMFLRYMINGLESLIQIPVFASTESVDINFEKLLLFFGVLSSKSKANNFNNGIIDNIGSNNLIDSQINLSEKAAELVILQQSDKKRFNCNLLSLRDNNSINEFDFVQLMNILIQSFLEKKSPKLVPLLVFLEKLIYGLPKAIVFQEWYLDKKYLLSRGYFLVGEYEKSYYFGCEFLDHLYDLTEKTRNISSLITDMVYTIETLVSLKHISTLFSNDDNPGIISTIDISCFVDSFIKKANDINIAVDFSPLEELKSYLKILELIPNISTPEEIKTLSLIKNKKIRNIALAEAKKLHLRVSESLNGFIKASSNNSCLELLDANTSSDFNEFFVSSNLIFDSQESNFEESFSKLGIFQDFEALKREETPLDFSLIFNETPGIVNTITKDNMNTASELLVNILASPKSTEPILREYFMNPFCSIIENITDLSKTKIDRFDIFKRKYHKGGLIGIVPEILPKENDARKYFVFEQFSKPLLSLMGNQKIDNYNKKLELTRDVIFSDLEMNYSLSSFIKIFTKLPDFDYFHVLAVTEYIASECSLFSSGDSTPLFLSKSNYNTNLSIVQASDIQIYENQLLTGNKEHLREISLSLINSAIKNGNINKGATLNLEKIRNSLLLSEISLDVKADSSYSKICFQTAYSNILFADCLVDRKFVLKTHIDVVSKYSNREINQTFPTRFLALISSDEIHIKDFYGNWIGWLYPHIFQVVCGLVSHEENIEENCYHVLNYFLSNKRIENFLLDVIGRFLEGKNNSWVLKLISKMVKSDINLYTSAVTFYHETKNIFQLINEKYFYAISTFKNSLNTLVQDRSISESSVMVAVLPLKKLFTKNPTSKFEAKFNRKFLSEIKSATSYTIKAILDGQGLYDVWANENSLGRLHLHILNFSNNTLNLEELGSKMVTGSLGRIPICLQNKSTTRDLISEELGPNYIINVDPECRLLMQTKTKPKLMTLNIENQGTVQKVEFILKQSEDLNSDLKIQKMWTLLNEYLSSSQIQCYGVIPIGYDGGFIQVVGNQESVYSIYKSYFLSGKFKLDEFKNMDVKALTNPARFYKLLSDPNASKIENYYKLSSLIPANLLNNYIYATSDNTYNFLLSIKEFVKSLGIASIAGYLIGLGDRHLDNILLNRATGRIMHVDLNMNFDRGLLLTYPETIPFRLSNSFQYIVGTPKSAMNFSGISNSVLFLESMVKTLLASRRCKEQLVLGIMNSFQLDPPIEWHLYNTNMEKSLLPLSNENENHTLNLNFSFKNEKNFFGSDILGKNYSNIHQSQPISSFNYNSDKNYHVSKREKQLYKKCKKLILNNDQTQISKTGFVEVEKKSFIPVVSFSVMMNYTCNLQSKKLESYLYVTDIFYKKNNFFSPKLIAINAKRKLVEKLTANIKLSELSNATFHTEKTTSDQWNKTQKSSNFIKLNKSRIHFHGYDINHFDDDTQLDNVYILALNLWGISCDTDNLSRMYEGWTFWF
ncbi:hypothetical protein BB559_004082, partial [Furculomyces boomerangus]